MKIKKLIAEYAETGTLLLLGLLCVVAAYVSVETTRASSSLLRTILFLLTFFSAVFAGGAALRLALRLSFRQEPLRRIIVTILTSYTVLTLSFASFYYICAATGDLVDAKGSYDFYRGQLERSEAHEGNRAYLRVEDGRALAGVRDRIWNGVEEYVHRERGFVAEFPPEAYVEATRREAGGGA